jgi:hypothetical protein
MDVLDAVQNFLDSTAILIDYPVLALVPAVVFWILFAISKSRPVMMAGLVWLGYFAYEFGMKLRILCSGDCNVRIDLILVYPLLFFVSLAGLVKFAIALGKKTDA